MQKLLSLDIDKQKRLRDEARMVDDDKENQQEASKAMRTLAAKGAAKGTGLGENGSIPSGAASTATGADGFLAQLESLLDKKIAPIKDRIDSLQFDVLGTQKAMAQEFSVAVTLINDHEVKLANLEAGETEVQKAFNERILAVELEQKSLRAEMAAKQLESQSSQGPSRKKGPPWASTPRADRDIFILTNLGWNLKKQEALEKARAVLRRADVPQPTHIVAPFGYGSCVEIKWSSIAVGLQAAAAIRDLKIPGHLEHTIWCGQISTKEERGPAKLFKTVSEALERAMGDRTDSYVVCSRTRKFFVLDRQIGAIKDGEFQWHESLKEIPDEALRKTLKDTIDEALSL